MPGCCGRWHGCLRVSSMSYDTKKPSRGSTSWTSQSSAERVLGKSLQGFLGHEQNLSWRSTVHLVLKANCSLHFIFLILNTPW